jgi:hypothetical protein
MVGYIIQIARYRYQSGSGSLNKNLIFFLISFNLLIRGPPLKEVLFTGKDLNPEKHEISYFFIIIFVG